AIVGPLHSKLLIEIAIVNFAAPADADGVAAHQAVNGRRIKILDEQVHVFLELVVVSQIRSEPRDRQIGDRVEIVEDNSEMFFELAFVIGFEIRLRRWKKRSDWIVNEMQWKIDIDAVA